MMRLVDRLRHKGRTKREADPVPEPLRQAKLPPASNRQETDRKEPARQDTDRKEPARQDTDRKETIQEETDPVEPLDPAPKHPITAKSDLVSQGDQWTAAYNAAIAQLDEDMRLLVSKGRNLDELFDGLSESNVVHKNQSILRRGLERMQKPLQLLDQSLDFAKPLTGLDPTSGAAFGIVHSVTLLAIGVCGVEARLNQQIANMLEQIKVIDQCDALGQKMDDAEDSAIFMTLVLVYKDLLSFYIAVTQILAKRSTALAFMSEQFNETLPPVLEDFIRHAQQLYRYIDNATAKIVESIESLLIDNQIRQLLGSHKVDHMDTLHLGLTKRTADDACQWVIEEPNFREWLGMKAKRPLALFGTMGCGKTVVMSFMINHIRRVNEAQIPSALICYHYCKADETGKSPNVFSNLIQQLMRQKPQIKIQFNKWHKQQQAEGNQSPTLDPTLLADFFLDAVESLNRPTFVFIDGVDECDDISCAEILEVFKKRSLSAAGLSFCVSARYQKDIQVLLTDSLEIHMPDNPERDAAIVSHMTKERLPFLNDEAKALVIEKLSGLAAGSAIWVQIAVDLLAKRKLSAPAKLKAFLRDELPGSQLPDMYEKLFSQVTGGDGDNARVLSDALEILAVAGRPMTIDELSWAVALRDPDADSTTVQGLRDYVDADRILDFLSPFIGGITYDAQKARQVQLVHQSLRELIFRCSPRDWNKPGVLEDTKLSGAGATRRRSALQGHLSKMCVRYLLMEDLENRELFSTEQNVTQALEHLPGFGAFSEDGSTEEDEPSAVQIPEVVFFDPSEAGFGEFFCYASSYWLQHMHMAEPGDEPKLSEIIILTDDRSRRSRNWWDQFHRPDCTLSPDESQRRPQSLDAFTLVSLYGSDSLVKELLSRFDVTNGEETALMFPEWHTLQHILDMGDPGRLILLMRYDAAQDISKLVRLFGRVMRELAYRQRQTGLPLDRFDAVFDHVAGAFNIMVDQTWGNEMLCEASDSGCLPFLKRIFAEAECNPTFKREILRTPQRPGGPGTVYHQSIGEAVWSRNSGAVAFLLEQDGIEAHLHFRDLNGDNVLHKAVRRAGVATLKLLLPRFPEGVNAKNDAGDTPLQVLIFELRPTTVLVEMVTMLLEAGADVRGGCTDSDWHEPIRMAVRYGDVTLCRVLVEIGGADPMSVFRSKDDLAFIDTLDKNEQANEIRNTLSHLANQRQTEVV